MFHVEHSPKYWLQSAIALVNSVTCKMFHVEHFASHARPRCQIPANINIMSTSTVANTPVVDSTVASKATKEIKTVSKKEANRASLLQSVERLSDEQLSSLLLIHSRVLAVKADLGRIDKSDLHRDVSFGSRSITERHKVTKTTSDASKKTLAKASAFMKAMKELEIPQSYLNVSDLSRF